MGSWVHGFMGAASSGRMTLKRFDIITEADARVLEPGSTVVLAPRGHVTPLAADTLRSRHVTVISDDPGVAADLVPVADVRRLAIASDHSGVALKRTLVAWARARGLAVDDLGVEDATPVDYPDVAARVARAVATREADAGIVIDGAGLGIGNRRQQDRGSARRDVPERNAGALCARAQRRQRAHARGDARLARRGACASSAPLIETPDAGSPIHRPARQDCPAWSGADAEERSITASLRRLIELIVDELNRHRADPARPPMRLSRRPLRVLPGSRSWRARRRSHPSGTPRQRQPDRQCRRADRPHAAQAGRHTGGHRRRSAARRPSSGSPRFASTRAGSRWPRDCCAGTSSAACSVVGFPLGATTRRRQALRDPPRDLRRRRGDRHGDQHRRAEVGRPSAVSSATSRRSRRPAARRAPSAR